MMRYIIPRPGMRVLCPDGTPLAETGAAVQWSSWWARRLRDGDITLEEPPATAGARRKSIADPAKSQES